MFCLLICFLIYCFLLDILGKPITFLLICSFFLGVLEFSLGKILRQGLGYSEIHHDRCYKILSNIFHEHLIFVGCLEVVLLFLMRNFVFHIFVLLYLFWICCRIVRSSVFSIFQVFLWIVQYISVLLFCFLLSRFLNHSFFPF